MKWRTCAIPHRSGKSAILSGNHRHKDPSISAEADFEEVISEEALLIDTGPATWDMLINENKYECPTNQISQRLYAPFLDTGLGRMLFSHTDLVSVLIPSQKRLHARIDWEHLLITLR